MKEALRLVGIILLMLYGAVGLCVIILVQKIRKEVQIWTTTTKR